MLNRGISYNYLTNINIGDNARLHAIVVTVGILQLPVKSRCFELPETGSGRARRTEPGRYAPARPRALDRQRSSRRRVLA